MTDIIARSPEPRARDLSRKKATAQSPKGLTWLAAAEALLRAVGYPDDISDVSSMQGLASRLEGTGFALSPVPIIHHIIPTANGMLGGLLEMQDGFWHPVLGSGEDVVCLSAASDAIGPLDIIDREQVHSAWILSERVISLASVKPFWQRYKKYFVDLFIAAFVVNLFALVLPLFSSFVYDKILGNGILATMWALVIGLGIVIGIELCIRIVRIHVAERFSIGSEVEIDYTTFRNLIDTKANKMPNIGSLLEKYKQILSFRDFLSSSYLLALADVPFLFLFLAVIAIVAGPLVLIPIISGVLLLISSLVTTAPILDYDRRARVQGERRFGLMTDILTAREAIIGSDIRNKLAERWRQCSVAAVQSASMARYWRSLGMAIAGSITSISFVAILVGGVYMVEAHDLTSGGLLAASMLSSRSMGAFSSIVSLTLRYREFRTALRELNQLVPVTVARASVKNHGQLQGAVRIDNVTCRLREGDTPVLNNINLNFRPGETIGIAGAPGAGKTTLLRLISGVLEPEEGRILIDNIPVDDLSPEDISANIGFKPQDFCLLEGTIEDNVRAGRPQLTAEARQQVLLSSGLLRAFNEGSLHWLSEVGPRGSQLSGGQRQMVSLARTLLSMPPIILLDEPTNGFDAVLENHLAGQIAGMREHSTVFISTHCRNVLAACDRIIVVGQGRILADGPSNKILV